MNSEISIDKPQPGFGRGRKTLLGIAGTAAAAGAVLIVSSGASTAAAAPTKQALQICHRTDSLTNPYRLETPANAGQLAAHLGHLGGVFVSATVNEKKSWGDIIPPFTYKGKTVSLNWPAGQAILDNNCKVATQTSSSSAPPTETTSTVSAPPSDTTSTVSAPPSDTTSTVSAPPSDTTSTTSAPPTDTSSTVAGSSSVAGESTSAAASSSSAGVAGVSTSVAASSSSAGAGVAGVSTSTGPIPGAVDAGLHAPIGREGLKAWGIVLLLLGGALGLGAGIAPTRRRAH